MIKRTFLLLGLLSILVKPLAAQAVINLDAVIGLAGTNAATVAGVGNAVNFTGYALNSGATTLIAAGSTGSAAFDFNTGFADTLDRATGSTAGAPNVFADLKYDSSSTSPLLLDTNNDGVYAEAALTGFGMHGDTFITFDLAVIRANNSLSAGTAFILTGIAGESNFTGWGQTSGAIIVDGAQRAVFDWTESGPANSFSTFTLNLSGSDRYVTFIGLSGLDASNWGAHIGFANVQLLQAVPEPSAVALLATGLIVLILQRRKHA